MSNSKESNKTSKSSFNKSKSKSISSAMDDLEMGRPISKDIDSEIDSSTFSSDLEGESNSNIDLEIVPEINEEPKSDKYDDLSSFLDEDDELTVEDDLASEDLEVNNEIELEESEPNEVILDESKDLNIEDEIFISPNESSESFDLEDTIDNKEDYALFDDELSLSKPVKKSQKPKSKKSSKKFKFGFSKKKSIFGGEKLSTTSKIFALLGLILGLSVIIYGIMSFANVSDRVIDNVLLGEAGSWAIVIILIGLIIILLDVFYIFYYKKSLSNSNIKNAQIRNTFNTIDKIKSIDSDYYQNESEDSLFKNFLKPDEEESENNLKTSTFEGEEIYVDHSVRDLDGLDSVEDYDESADFDDIDVSDSNNIDSFNDENSIFENEEENLSNQIDDLEIVPEIEETKADKYDDLSSFLDEDDDLDKSEFKKSVDIGSIIKESKPKSADEDLAAKKARIIEGTNFDNSLRKSKK